VSCARPDLEVVEVVVVGVVVVVGLVEIAVNEIKLCISKYKAMTALR